MITTTQAPHRYLAVLAPNSPYSPPETFAQFKAKWSKRLDGDDLWKKIIAYSKEQTQKPEPGCFVAGTLVHTQEGLRPIEQIKVGDMVLSKPESGEGAQSYQPVTKTFSYENRELYLVGMNELDRVTGKGLRYETEYFAVSGSHPIWVNYFQQFKFKGDDIVITPVNAWVTVEDYYLKYFQAALDSLEKRVTLPTAYGTLANGSPVVIYGPSRIVKGHKADEGVRFDGDNDTWKENCMAKRIRFGVRGAELLRGPGSYTTLGDAEEANYDYTGYDVDSPMSLVKLSGGHLPIRRTVYNIEVANSHTYFVGELGLWVHNKNPSGVPLLPSVAQSPTQSLKVDDGDKA